MSFQNFLFGLALRTSLCSKTKPVILVTRLFHGVHHNPENQVFYVAFRNFDKKAVLNYRTNGQLMDIRAINVPSKFKGLGIAKLLTETVFTYAIVNDYYLYLTCSYAQKYYLANRNKSLDKRIAGPRSLLEGANIMAPEIFEGLPDPSDPVSGNRRS